VWKLVKWPVSLGLLAWLALSADWGSTLATLRSLPPVVLLVGPALMGMAQLLSTRRLQVLLRAQGIERSYGAVLRLTFAGLFAGNFLPSSVGGDTLKVVRLAQQGYGTVKPAACIVVDRLVSLVSACVLVLSVLFVPALLPTSGSFSIARLSVLALLLAGTAVLGLVVLGQRQRRRSTTTADDAAAPLRSPLRKRLDALLAMLAQWGSSTPALLVALLLSWGNFLFSVAALWVIAQGLGIVIQPLELLAVSMLTYFVTLLPISLNGLGVKEVSTVYLLAQLGATPEQGLALAIVARLFYVALSLLGVFDILLKQERGEHIHAYPDPEL
jgi:hypothetical protein